jgi:hypothetical protein
MSPLNHDTGVLCAPTAFGKTVTAAAMIAGRGVNTLVLVHRTELLKQWQERLQSFPGVGKGRVNTLGGGKAKPTGKSDIAVIQSLSRQGEVNPLVENYGHVIVDECHHVGAASFDAILKRTKAKFVLGLTATPIRRDGQQPIIFMQCGPIRYKAAKPAGAPHDLEVVSRSRSARVKLGGLAIFRKDRHLPGLALALLTHLDRFAPSHMLLIVDFAGIQYLTLYHPITTTAPHHLDLLTELLAQGNVSSCWLDVLVHPEEVRRVVFVLQLHQPLVHRTVGERDAVGLVLGEEVDVRAAAGEGL